MADTKGKGVPVVRAQAPNPWDHRAHMIGEMATWQPPLTSIDNDIQPGFAVNRARSRELAMVNPYGVNAAETIKDAVIGRRFSLCLVPDADYLGVSTDEADEWASLTEKEWSRYAEGITFDVDATRKSTFTFQMHQVQEGMHVDGEALGIVRAKEGQLGYVTCLQLIEPERLDDRNVAASINQDGTQTRFGVVRDEYGEPIAYEIRNQHPGEALWTGTRDQVTRIERYSEHGRPQVLHVFDDFRPAMTRGVSRQQLSSLKQMKMLGAFGDAELSRSIMSSSWAAVIETELNYEQAMQVIGAGGLDPHCNNLTAASIDHLRNVAPYYRDIGMRYNGAKVAHLMPGDELKIIQSSVAGAQFDLFEKAFIRQLAAGLNISYEELSRDFSGVSYAAARQSLEFSWRRYVRLRAMLVAKFAMPYVSAWMEEAIVTKRLPMLGSKFRPTPKGFRLAKHGLCVGDFISWGKPVIDPVKETTGSHMRMALGLTTLRDEVAQEGEDYAEVLRQRAREMRERAKLGLNVGGIDPSLVIGGRAPGPDKGAGPAPRKARQDGPG